ncbi:MAG: TonB-dependent receptor, partial [Flavisolibacter sp.]|nr:TonB-dependent receptor [Flavisolibacter sp.]
MKNIKPLLLLFLCLPAFTYAQVSSVTLSGVIRESKTKNTLAYVNVILRQAKDSSFVAGTVTNDEGLFTISGVTPNEYTLQLSYTGYKAVSKHILVGKLSSFLNIGTIDLETDINQLNEVVITATQQDDVSNKLDKKTFSISNNITQSGGSVLQAMKNLPGITISQEGKVQLRGSERVAILIDGKQTALSGFGNQAALDNIPASAIERIEIINNPSARYDANGNAGIINIIYKKNRQEGFNGKVGLMTGLGALWEKKESLPGIRPQYNATPKIKPSLSLNYRQNKINLFAQGDWLYNETLNKNDFIDRYYTNGDTIRHQVKRNRITTVGTAKAGADWQLNENNLFTISGLYSSEYVRDRGDIPFFNRSHSVYSRLWQFYEDEVNTAATASGAYQHKFRQPGHILNVSLNYTFHREDEKYFLTNIMPSFTGKDTFMLIADEHVTDLNIDYIRPLKQGRVEGGIKFRRRNIPTN